jgi:uracil DNA glycosylase
MLRELSADVFEVIQNEPMSVRAPPIGNDPFGQHDQIAGLLFSVDDESAEAVALKSRHYVASSQRL